MDHSRHRKLFVALFFSVFSTTLFLYSIRFPLDSSAQDEEKSLEILRYPNEPLELVDLTIGQTSVKKDIKAKVRGNNRPWQDSVKLNDKENSLRTIKLALRNVSGRPIYSVIVSIRLISDAPRTGFLLPLRKLGSRNLKQQPLQPGEEIELGVAENSFNETMATITKYGRDANQLKLILHVDEASFGNDLIWRQGVLMRKDPNDPSRWKPVAYSMIRRDPSCNDRCIEGHSCVFVTFAHQGESA
jgi:hypothetical protein